MKERFAKVAAELEENEDKITAELLAAQGAPVDIGGYFHPDEARAERRCGRAATFNAIIDAL